MKGNIELLRIVCVVLLVFTHTRHNFNDGIMYFMLYDLPKYGTLILSIISGYLYYSISRKNKNLFKKKIKSLAIPFLLANISVVIIVSAIFIIFDLNYLNRLSFDSGLVMEGIFSLNSPPINPPTYFIRDVFIIFVLVEILIKKKFKLIFLILPFAFFGELILRYEILVLFIIGIIISKYLNNKNQKYIQLALLILLPLSYYFCEPIIKHLISIFIFISIINIKIKFFNVGGYTYLLHLYHSPVIVFIYPLLSKYISNIYMLVISQIILSIIVVYLLFLITRKFAVLKILSGQR
tara:strand:- start:570 stop:1451 length:882 start_codon:yes stop_codon:yes gene_type:complete